MKLTVVGTGYVGLVTGACLADTGHHVTCVDIDAGKVKRLSLGEIPIYEPGLEEVVRRNVGAGRLAFTIDLQPAVESAEVIMIAVGTPPGEDGSADLSHVLGVAADIAEYMNGHKIIVTKSTVPVGTNERVRQVVAERTEHEFDVVSNPEFLKEGEAVNDFMKPDRIVIGIESGRAKQVMEQLYEPFQRTGERIVWMNIRAAELTKYAANAMLATRISFMNEVATLCERLGVDVEDVRRGIGADPRIGKHFLFAGLGWGGSCFPKDVRALSAIGEEVGLTLRLIEAAKVVNDRQQLELVRFVHERFGIDLRGVRLAAWGLAFKPRTDDVREASAVRSLRQLVEAGATVSAYDPAATATARVVLGDTISYAADPYEAAEGADALLIFTEWQEFRAPDLAQLRSAMRQPTIFDGRNVLNPTVVRAAGFEYRSIGRP